MDIYFFPSPFWLWDGLERRGEEDIAIQRPRGPYVVVIEYQEDESQVSLFWEKV